MRSTWMSAALLIVAAMRTEAADPALRPESLVLNETLPLAGSVTQRWPLYLWRQGDYLVEAIAEPAGSELTATYRIKLSLTFTREEKVLLRRDATLTLGPAQQSAALLWFRTDREIPLRAEVQVDAALDTAVTGAADRLRLQIRRKPNLVERR